MTELTSDQRTFLAEQGIPLSKVFDATGMRKVDYQEAMRQLDKAFAYGVTPCSRALHTLRTRAGHCVQCDHSKIAYMLHHDATAFIYIAASASGRLLKVGSSGDIQERRSLLNAFRYGGQRDWQMIAHANCPRAGRVESAVHAKLVRFQTTGRYEQGGRLRTCYELFRCDFADARDAIRAELPQGILLTIPDNVRAEAAFAFRAT